MQQWGTADSDSAVRGQPGQSKGGDSIDQHHDAGGAGTGAQCLAQQRAEIW